LSILLLECLSWKGSLFQQSRNWIPVNYSAWQNMCSTWSINRTLKHYQLLLKVFMFWSLVVMSKIFWGCTVLERAARKLKELVLIGGLPLVVFAWSCKQFYSWNVIDTEWVKNLGDEQHGSWNHLAGIYLLVGWLGKFWFLEHGLNRVLFLV
jgi:hypothetical protein